MVVHATRSASRRPHRGDRRTVAGGLTEGDFRYQQIANELRKMVHEGIYRPGDKLPTERQLSRQFHVAHLTIRRAHQDLEAEGVIRRERGRGTFVCDTPRRIAVEPSAPSKSRVGYISVDRPMEGQVFQLVRAGLERGGRRLLLDVMDQPSVVTRLPELIAQEGLELVLLDGRLDESWIRSLAKLPVPVLVCGTIPPTPGVASVTPDMEIWAYELTRLLLQQLRFEHVWLVVEPLRLYYNRLLVAGYRRALRDCKGPAEMVVLCDDDRWDPFTRQFSLLQPQLSGRHAVIWMYRYPFVPMSELPSKAVERLGVVNYGQRSPGWFIPPQCDLGILPTPDPQYAQLIVQLALDMLKDQQLRGVTRTMVPAFSAIKGAHGPAIQLHWQI